MQPSSSSSPRVSLPFTDRKLPAAARVVGAMPPDEVMRVSVIVKRKQPLDLAGLGGRHVSRTEFNSKYAASAEAFDELRRFAEQHGLSVDANASSLDRRTLVLTGTAAQMQQAFGVELQQVEHGGLRYRIHKQPATMPRECASMVDAVLGLGHAAAGAIASSKAERFAAGGGSRAKLSAATGGGDLQLSNRRERKRRDDRHCGAGRRFYDD